MQLSNRKGDFREVGIGYWQYSQGSFFKFADDQLAVEWNKGHFWNLGVYSAIQWYQDVTPTRQGFFNRRIYSPWRAGCSSRLFNYKINPVALQITWRQKCDMTLNWTESDGQTYDIKSVTVAAVYLTISPQCFLLFRNDYHGVLKHTWIVMKMSPSTSTPTRIRDIHFIN